VPPNKSSSKRLFSHAVFKVNVETLETAKKLTLGTSEMYVESIWMSRTVANGTILEASSNLLNRPPSWVLGFLYESKGLIDHIRNI
jgi:hypothetical protein